MKNTAYFLDFEFATEGLTFHPRFETEILAKKAIDLLSKGEKATSVCNILDIGTGCGNIAISLAKHIPLSRIVALDISDGALRIAGRNAAKCGLDGRIEFVKSNLFENIKNRYELFFDLIISNPPYVSLGDFTSLPPEVKADPYIALYGGKDGLDFYRRIVNDAPFYLKRRGSILMEIGYGQARGVKAMLDDRGIFCDVEIYKDYAGIDRIVKAEINVQKTEDRGQRTEDRLSDF